MTTDEPATTISSALESLAPFKRSIVTAHYIDGDSVSQLTKRHKLKRADVMAILEAGLQKNEDGSAQPGNPGRGRRDLKRLHRWAHRPGMCCQDLQTPLTIDGLIVDQVHRVDSAQCESDTRLRSGDDGVYGVPFRLICRVRAVG